MKEWSNNPKEYVNFEDLINPVLEFYLEKKWYLFN